MQGLDCVAMLVHGGDMSAPGRFLGCSDLEFGFELRVINDGAVFDGMMGGFKFV